MRNLELRREIDHPQLNPHRSDCPACGGHCRHVIGTRVRECALGLYPLPCHRCDSIERLVRGTQLCAACLNGVWLSDELCAVQERFRNVTRVAAVPGRAA